MKNKIFSIILIILLSLPISVSAVDNVIQDTTTGTETPAVEEVETTAPANLDEDNNASVQETAPIPYKQPNSRRKVIKKFVMAMMGVAVSSFLIFFILTLYNKIRGKINNQVKTPEGDTSLETPYDMESAVRTFIDKTNWKI